jgi:hypothetical protein
MLSLKNNLFTYIKQGGGILLSVLTGPPAYVAWRPNSHSVLSPQIDCYKIPAKHRPTPDYDSTVLNYLLFSFVRPLFHIMSKGEQKVGGGGGGRSC